MITVRSFRSKILIALVGVALVPAVLIVTAGTLALGEFVATSGTAGPWQSVAESGQALLEAVEAEGSVGPEVSRAADEHRAALTESVRLSRLYALVSERVLELLPLIGLGTVLLVGGLSVLAARSLSRIFSGPIRELVGWTERIARGEPLPDPEHVPPAGVREFERLREALRTMARELESGRARAVEAARLRSWTEMARGVAHEIKNPLMPMRMAAGTVAMMDERRAAEAGRVLLEEIDRLDGMARSFSRLGRMPEGPTSEIDLTELLAEALAPYREADVDVALDLPDDLPLIVGWYDPVLRIFQNLVGNAFQAVEGRTSPSERWIRISARAAGGAVEVSVVDSGPGLPEGTASQIWDPDFTTSHKGTGLGLTLVRQAVEAHGGTVVAREATEPRGAGAEFTVRLPVQGPPESTRDSSSTSNSTPIPASSSTSSSASGPAS